MFTKEQIDEIESELRSRKQARKIQKRSAKQLRKMQKRAKKVEANAALEQEEKATLRSAKRALEFKPIENAEE